ncbi:Splicing factor 3A subunit 2 [Microbotryomycetes sp. NB124-2]
MLARPTHRAWLPAAADRDTAPPTMRVSGGTGQGVTGWAAQVRATNALASNVNLRAPLSSHGLPSSKFGGGGVAGASETAVDRRERLRKLALETIDLAKDPYILRNHLGGLECRLCLTLHTNEGSYLAHTQGKKHQTNLARRAARDSYNPDQYAQQLAAQQAAQKNAVPTKTFIKIGSPGYQVTKVRDPITGQLGLLYQVHYPKIKEGVKPRHRFMSAYEQHVEQPDRAWQYLLIAAEPYQTIAFKIQAREIDSNEGMSWDHWDPDTKTLSFQFMFAQQK